MPPPFFIYKHQTITAVTVQKKHNSFHPLGDFVQEIVYRFLQKCFWACYRNSFGLVIIAFLCVFCGVIFLYKYCFVYFINKKRGVSLSLGFDFYTPNKMCSKYSNKMKCSVFTFHNIIVIKLLNYTIFYAIIYLRRKINQSKYFKEKYVCFIRMQLKIKQKLYYKITTTKVVVVLLFIYVIIVFTKTPLIYTEQLKMSEL